MASAQNTDTTALYSAPDYLEVASIASDVDITDTTTGLSGCTRAIRCDTAGVLIVKNRHNVSRTLRFQAGETQYVVARSIVSAGSSGCVPITVYA